MRRLWPEAPFPLLGKELVEQAARRRTYIVRTLYAALLFVVFLVNTGEYFSDSAQVAARLGHGKAMFNALLQFPFAGILLFLPAMMAGVLTYEKERQSMALLLLTDMTPREILMEKFLSRLVPAVNFVLLSLPLLAFCYAYGGVTRDRLTTGVAGLLLTCAQVGALALVFSSLCSTSAGALVCTYLAEAVLYLGLPLVISWMFGLSGPDEDWIICHVPLFLYLRTDFARIDAGSAIAGVLLPQLLTVMFLLLARVYLVRRAFATPRNLAVAVLKWLDGVFESVNDAFGGVRFGKARHTSLPPGDHPVAWREVTRKSLGRPTYLIRVVLLLTLPVALIAGAGVSTESPSRAWGDALSVWSIVIWTVAGLAVAILSANAIASERSSQTLDVLLTTPLETREIVREKLRGVRRLILVLFIPFIAMFALRAFWMDTVGLAGRGYLFGWLGSDWPWWYLVCSTLAVAVFLPMISWLSVFIAMLVRSRFRAIIAIFLILAVWNGVPLVLLRSSPPPGGDDPHTWMVLHWLVPASAIAALETGMPAAASDEPMMAWLAISFLIYAFAGRLLRRLCVSQADAYLGRAGLGSRRRPGHRRPLQRRTPP